MIRKFQPTKYAPKLRFDSYGYPYADMEEAYGRYIRYSDVEHLLIEAGYTFSHKHGCWVKEV